MDNMDDKFLDEYPVMENKPVMEGMPPAENNGKRRWYETLHRDLDLFTSGDKPILRQSDKKRVEAYLTYAQIGRNPDAAKVVLRKAFPLKHGEEDVLDMLPVVPPILPEFEGQSELGRQKSVRNVIALATGHNSSELNAWKSGLPIKRVQMP
ncbi:hypothetical protein KW795_02900 [Candidatus Microgenomates bacterium]|nr:hypothetical protein [Candidatus Microgenomates bacterium]